MPARNRGLVSSQPRPVRVMHVVYAMGVGGMEMGVIKLVTGLDRSVVESSVCSCSPVEAMSARWATEQTLFTLDRRAGNDPTLIAKLYRLFRREKPDIVHTHAWGTLCEGVAAAKLAGVPLVVHGEHGTMDLRPRNLWVQRKVWGRADRVLAVSSALAERMAAATGFPLQRITVIRNGVDLERFGRPARDASRRSLGLAADTFVIGTVGRLVPVKDHETFLRAVAMVHERGIPVKALITGEGPLRNELQARAGALGLQDDVMFLGARDDVPAVMAALDVFVLTSRSEGLSNTVLEAMASGLPVVATRVGGNLELVQEGATGTLVPAESPEAVAAAVLGLRGDGERRRRWGLAGRLRADLEFSLTGMLRRYQNLYTTVSQAASPLSVAVPADAVGATRLSSGRHQ